MLYLFGGAFACVGKCRSCGAHITFHFVCTQGFISGFALIPPWAMRGYRPFRAHCRIGCVFPGFHIGLCPHSTLGYAGVSPFQGSLSDCLLFSQGFISGFALISPWAMQERRPCRAHYRIVCCLPRVSYRASPSFHPGLCRSIVLAGLIVGLGVFPQGFISGFALIPPWAMRGCRPCRALCRIGCVSPGFHIGLRPHFTLGYAGVSPLQGSLSDWAFAVLCRGIVFVKCVWVCVNGLLRLCFCI